MRPVLSAVEGPVPGAAEGLTSSLAGLPRTLLVMAGGTGGHVFPGLAVADCLRRRGWRVVWLGTRDGMEAGIVPRHGYPMAWVRFAGLRGKGPGALLLLPLRLAIACWQCGAALFRHRPDVALGMGGYVSFPGGLMAALLRRPLVIHEQNAVSGLTNKLLARLARRVLTGFPGVLPRGEWCGNPVRREIAALPDPATRYRRRSGPVRLLVVGGSLGAAALNQVVPQALALLPEQERPQVLHQSGAAHLETLRQAYAAAFVSAETVAFIEDMAAAYAEADLVVCRAGALTVAELAAAGVASVLVPYPHAVDDHQTANARFLAEGGAAWLIPQAELTPLRLTALLQEARRESLLAMASKARALTRPDAALRVAEVCAAAAG